MSNHLDYEINKELGECYLFMGDLDKAEDYYRKAIAGASTQAAPYLGLATIAVQRGKMDDALVLYNKAAALENSDKALSGIGLVLMEQGHHQQAFEHFENALDLNADNMVALNCLVREGYYLGYVDRILPRLEACLAITNEQAAVRVTMAGCLMSLGRRDEAKQHLEAVLGIDPSNANARDLFESIAA